MTEIKIMAETEIVHALVNIIDKILTAHPWLTSLEKCSSVEELEMMLAINGVTVG